MQNNFIEITPRYGCSRTNLLHIFRTLFLGTPLGGCFCILVDRVVSFDDNLYACKTCDAKMKRNQFPCQ